MPLETRIPVNAVAVFPPRRGYASLSIKDLLDARDAYHVYLSSLENVTATAIGKYLIHEKDWYAEHPPGTRKPANYKKPTTPRSLSNSVIRPWSWPAVLVFVKKWEPRSNLGANVVPQTLYLSDGRVIPVCVIEAEPDAEFPPTPPVPFPTTPLVGGGYSCLRQNQGEENFGTITCLVRKGGTYYALTNRHVAGGEGDIVRAFIRGQFQPVGTTSPFALDRSPMPNLFPGWPYSKTLLTMDAGLVRIDDINDWTSQGFGIGEIGDLFDATEYSLTLDLIGTPVRAFSAESGVSEGEIRALFFRFESAGGFDYVTDTLIAPRRVETNKASDNQPFTRPGDSGALWFYDQDADTEAHKTNQDLHQPPTPPPERGERAPRMRPVAIQWGGQRVVNSDGTKGSYALATFFSSVCRALDVEVVRNWSLGHEEYWGKIGHFTIGFKACEHLSGKLATLMQKNQVRIGFDDAKLSGTFTVDRSGFVPLVDVPDYVWVNSRHDEPIQHFADIDIQDINGNPSLLAQCTADSKNISASAWKAYFDGFAKHGVGPEEGALPFRVWQIYDAMVGYVAKRDLIHFVAAAGIMGHYVGDASQPLHCSFLHHGVPPMTEFNGRSYPFPRNSDEFKNFKTTPPAEIHGIYEESMLEIDPALALSLVDEKIASMTATKFPAKAGGHYAATQTIRLMHDAQTRLSPMDIINADNPSLTKKNRAKALWNNLTIRNATVTSLADSVLTLAAIWEAAWDAGNGASVPKSKLAQFSERDLINIYRNEEKFIPSLSLDAMAKSGDFEP
ncbi:MAG: hypothetical protein JWM99_3626 [Verrucomicrobiales bacterium]|nr:hypothetical protein [Verrucomicrobiales bacterium]